jgi:hypothetical protein
LHRAVYFREYPPVAELVLTENVWFDADVPKTIEMMRSHREEAHLRQGARHPLLSTWLFVPFQVVRAIVGLPQRQTAMIVVALFASVWVILLFIFLRRIGCRRLDATVFCSLGAMTAAAVFWFSVPESFSLGSITILGALCYAAGIGGQRPTLSDVSISALTLSVTVTNWMAGIFVAFVGLPWRRAVTVTGLALAMVYALWVVQSFFFGGFLPPFVATDMVPLVEDWTNLYGFVGYLDRALSVVFHTVVSPAPSLELLRSGNLSFVFVGAPPGRAGVLCSAACLLWLSLFSIGLWALVRSRQEPICRVLALTAGGHFALHLMFGRDVFLYSLHVAPVLVSVGALGTRTRARPYCLSLAVLLAVTAGVHNHWQFDTAARLVDEVVLAPLREGEPPPESYGGSENTAVPVHGTREMRFFVASEPVCGEADDRRVTRRGSDPHRRNIEHVTVTCHDGRTGADYFFELMDFPFGFCPSCSHNRRGRRHEPE